ncbi:uncharacterized protein PAC_13764 [Phialocephala subalpina]|uniref:Uncharacterized protein n=1 Tax=Phialocephala subalpina TaxID=576137 RepID=A0A1L7XFZ4_9HELO|nr:uncharacterized protein PAC_13764 [Phialocephala subalpina]
MAISVEENSGILSSVAIQAHSQSQVSIQEDLEQAIAINGNAPAEPPTIQSDTSNKKKTFDDLPDEMKLRIMGESLPVMGPITNPWMESNWDEDRHAYHPSRYFAEFNIGVFRVSKEWNALGMETLYTHSIFRFTRRVAAIPGYKMPTIRIQRFPSEKVAERPMNAAKKVARRSDQIRHVLIQDSDLDSDALAIDGYGRDLSLFTPTDDPFVFTLAVLCRLASLKCRLLTLVITIDEENPRALAVLESSLIAGQELDARPNIDPAPEQLDFEQRMFNYYRAATITPEERQARTIGWHNVEAEDDDSEEEDNQKEDKQPAPEDPFKFCKGFQGLGVVNLEVRGTTDPNEDVRRMRPRGTPVAAALVRWLMSHHTKVEKLRFGGAFTRRQLAEDGTLIPVPVPAPVTSDHQQSNMEDENDDGTEIDGDDTHSQTESDNSVDIYETVVEGEGLDAMQWVPDVGGYEEDGGLNVERTGENEHIDEEEAVVAEARPAANNPPLSTTASTPPRAREAPFVTTGNLYGMLGQDLPEHRPAALPNNRRDVNRPYVVTGNLYEILGGGFSEYASWEDFARAWKARFAGRPGGDQPPRW